VRVATACSRTASFAAYGRAAVAASCARRSLAAATIFIARVIFWVFLTDVMRLRMIFRLAMAERAWLRS